jgi:hypothetical protein
MKPDRSVPTERPGLSSLARLSLPASADAAAASSQATESWVRDRVTRRRRQEPVPMLVPLMLTTRRTVTINWSGTLALPMITSLLS